MPPSTADPPDRYEVLEWLPLPHLTFDSASLQLTSVNAAARTLFHLSSADIGRIDAAYFFREGHALAGEEGTADSHERELGTIRDELLELFKSDDDGGPAWVWERSNGHVLHLWASDGTGLRTLRTCIAVVQASRPAGFAITLLQSLPSATARKSSQRLRRPTIDLPGEAAGLSSSPTTPSSASFPPLTATTSAPTSSGTDSRPSSSGVKDHTSAPEKLSNILSRFRTPGGRAVDASSMQEILDNLPQICFTASPEGKLTYLNKQWYTYTGLTEDDSFDPERWTDLFHPDDLAGAVVAFTHSMVTGNLLKMEYRIKAADGSWHWHVASGVALKDADGTIVQWVSVITDVEELVQVRSDALKAREHITAVLHGADIVLLTVDRDVILTFIEGSSRALSFTTDHSPTTQISSNVGRPLKDIWPDPRLYSEVVEMLSKKDEWEERFILHSDLDTQGPAVVGVEERAERRAFRYRLVPLEGAGPDGKRSVTGIIVVCADITELVKAESELRKANEERTRLLVSENAAKEASRLKTEFVTNTSHELRTPISAILGIFELLLDDPTVQKAQRSLVKKGVRSAEILLELVGRVLDLGKVEAGRLVIEQVPFYISEAAEDAALFSVAAKKKGISFEEDFGILYEGLLLGDQLRLRQVLANGLSNAVKFTDQGGVVLRIHQLSETALQVLIKIVIEDTGIGITEETLPKLFTPFMQADSSTARRFGGSGLGLVITKKLVEHMGGTVELESTPGSGTRMTITLPFDKAPPSETSETGQRDRSSSNQSASGAVATARDAKTVRLLLAEDNTLIREIVTKTLTKMGFQVESVEVGEKALEAVQASMYDLILMDAHMPSMDGLESTRAIRALPDERISKIKIVALTASASQSDKDRCLQAGMDGYLSKPVRAKDLEAAIWKHLSQQ